MDNIRFRANLLLNTNINLMTTDELTSYATRIDTLLDSLGMMRAGGDERLELANQLQQKRDESRERRLNIGTQGQAPTHQHNDTSTDTTKPSPKIRQFDETPRGWIRFKEEVNCYILNTKMTPQQKLIEIKKNIGSKWEDLLAKCPGTEEGVQTAMQLLERNFGNADMLVEDLQARISKLTQLTNNSPGEHWQAAMILATEVATITDDRITQTRLKDNLIEKLPEETAHNIECQIDCDIETVIQVIEGGIRGASRRAKRKPAVVEGREARGHQGGDSSRPKRSRWTNENPGRRDECKACGDGHHPLWACKASAREIRKVARSRNLCYRCLEAPADSKHREKCPRKCLRCGGSHATVLHFEQQTPSVQRVALQDIGKPRLPSLMVDAIGQDGPVRTRLGIDTYATFNTISKKLAGQLKLTVRNEAGPIRAYAFEAEKPITLSGDYTMVKLRNTLSGGETMEVRAYLTEQQLPYEDYSITAQIRQELSTKRIDMLDPHGPVEVFIGAQDYFTKLICKNQASYAVAQGDLMAMPTKIGYYLAGSAIRAEDAVQIQRSIQTMIDDDVDASNQHIKKILTNEALEPDDNMSNEAEKKWARTIKEQDGRFVINLPWVGPARPAPNYDVAFRQFVNLMKTLRNKEASDLYMSELKKFEEENQAEDIPDGANLYDGHYLLQIPVVKKAESGSFRVRPVFHASFRSGNGRSLNDCLHKGVTGGPTIAQMLLRLRCHPKVCLGDIKKAFLQIQVCKEDRKYLRFFTMSPDGAIRPKQMKVLLFGATNSPAALRAALGRALCWDQAVLDQLYMDDLLIGGRDEEEVKEKLTNITTRLGEHGFELHKLRGPQPSAAPEEEEPTFLGMLWRTKLDRLQVNPPTMIFKRYTRRELEANFARLYDPLGLLQPYRVLLQAALQDVVVGLKLARDARLPEDMKASVIDLAQQCQHVKEISVPRYPFPEEDWLLVGFADGAGSMAYGGCVYVYSLDGRRGHLLAARSRLISLATRTSMTAPRVELAAALVLAELAAQVLVILRSLKKEPRGVRLFSDSMVTLARLEKNTNKLDRFVRTRVMKIKEFVPEAVWHHVGTNLNPADLLSRGAKLVNLRNCDLWWKGPRGYLSDLWSEGSAGTAPGRRKLPESSEVVSLPGTSRARQRYKPTDRAANDESIGDEIVRSTIGASLDSNRQSRVEPPVGSESPTVAEFEDCTPTDASIPMGDESEVRASIGEEGARGGESFDLGLQTTTRMPGTSRPLDANEVLERLELLFRDPEEGWRIVQRDLFMDDIELVKQGKAVEKSSRLNALPLCLKPDRLLRLHTRLEQSNLPEEAKYPIVLADHPVVRSLIMAAHHDMAHGGAETVRAHLRQFYHILNGPRLIRRTISKCLSCRKIKARAYNPPPAALPWERSTRGALPFQFTMVDLFGPIRRISGSDGYGFIFVCAVSRAIHLEVIKSRSAASILNAMLRFFARRGVPTRIISDNERGFKKVDIVMSQIYKHLEKLVHTNEEMKKPIWTFNPPAAPWMGGSWERLIQTVKRGLKAIQLGKSLTFDEFGTLLTQIEAIVNDRPITYDSDRRTSLCPNDLLLQRRANLPRFVPRPNIIDWPTCSAVESYLEVQRGVKSFWNRWAQEYIVQLRAEQARGGFSEPVKGDRVIIKEDYSPRIQWLEGVVIEEIKGRDGATRAARIQLDQGGELVRPARLLCRLGREECRITMGPG